MMRRSKSARRKLKPLRRNENTHRQRLIDLHPPEMGMHLLHTYKSESLRNDFGTVEWYVLTAILCGAAEARERMSTNLNGLLVVGSVLLSAIIPVYIEPFDDSGAAVSEGYAFDGVNSTQLDVDTIPPILIWRQGVAGISVCLIMLGVLSSAGTLYGINMAVRDIDLVNMLQEVGWFETYLCFVPIMFGSFLAAVAVVLHGWYIAPVPSQVTAACLGVVVLLNVWGPIKSAIVFWSGIRHSKTDDPLDAHKQMIEEAKTVLEELHDIYGDVYGVHREDEDERAAESNPNGATDFGFHP